MNYSLIFVFFSALFITSCSSESSTSKNPVEARKQLTEIGVEYTYDRFLLSIKEGDVLSIKLFLDSGMDVNAENGKALLMAASAEQYDAMKLLLENGANPNNSILGGNFGREQKRSILGWCAYAGDNKAVALLLSHGAEVNYAIENGESALASAVTGTSPEVVKVLVAHGAEINDSIIDEAIRRNDEATFIPLLESKDFTESMRGIALHRAVSQQHIEIIKALLDGGVDVDYQDDNGNTGLHIAARQGRIAPAKYLMERGADHRIKNVSGRTPLMEVVLYEKPPFITFWMDSYSSIEDESNIIAAINVARSSIRNKRGHMKVTPEIIAKQLSGYLTKPEQPEQPPKASPGIYVEDGKVAYSEAFLKEHRNQKIETNYKTGVDTIQRQINTWTKYETNQALIPLLPPYPLTPEYLVAQMTRGRDAPLGGPAYAPGVGNPDTGTIGIIVETDKSNSVETITITKPAFGDLQSETNNFSWKRQVTSGVSGDQPISVVDRSNSAAAKSGKEVYDSHCQACHTTGAAGAPKIGDKSAWAPRLEKGMDALLTSAVNGVAAMPPRGLCMKCTDEELLAAIEYITSGAGN